MIVSDQMEQAVCQKKDHFVEQASSAIERLTACCVDRDDHVAQCSHTNRCLEGTRFLEREGEYIGRTILSSVARVQAANVLIVR